MSSMQFYEEVFRCFSSANYFSLTENHRQGDDFEKLTIPYRQAILSGNAKDRAYAVSGILADATRLPNKLSGFSREDAMPYIQKGTLGILTRTNGQALQISAWLRNEDIPHMLQRGIGTAALGDWISKLFCNFDNDTIDETSFITKHLALFPGIDSETAKNRWIALVSAQSGHTKHRYEVADLLRGIIRNTKELALYESNDDKPYAITVSNIHRAKGREFDSVIILDDVIEARLNTEDDEVLEHKVCYVALTRPKKKIELAIITESDKWIYLTSNADRTKRCSKASFCRRSRYISHFEVGGDMDLDLHSFAVSEDMQRYIQQNIRPGVRLRLIKCKECANRNAVYRIVCEDNEKNVLGYTSESFARELEKAMQHIMHINSPVYFNVYPHAFVDVYVDNIITCISGIALAPPGAKIFGDMSVWTGVTITGFAKVDKDTY